MPNSTHIQIRDARDRLIDLLGLGHPDPLRLGHPYPLRDLAISDERLVPFNTTAKIQIQDSQKGVMYQLYDMDNTPVGAQKEGNGKCLMLETPKIVKNTSYRISAQKRSSGKVVYLDRTVTVKVGIDTALQARILEAAIFTAPPMVSYGAQVEVEIQSTQEGVDYRLVAVDKTGEIELSKPDIRGNLGAIRLQTGPMYEDTDIRIRATKTFESEEANDETTLLAIVLPLKVRPNPALPVKVASPIIDHNATATVSIANTQQSVQYRVYSCPIPDENFIYAAIPEAECITVPVPDKPDVRVHTPSHPEVGSVPETYTTHGAWQQGTGGDLRITTESLTDDSLIMVQACKAPQAAHVVSSTVQLGQVAVVLVRPIPSPALQFYVLPENAASLETVQVVGGQPGVFYHFRQTYQGPDLGLPVYFHQRNRGLNEVTLEVDFVIAPARPPGAEQPLPDPDRTALEPQVWEPGRFDLNRVNVLSIQAVKALTGVETTLALKMQITAEPASNTYRIEILPT